MPPPPSLPPAPSPSIVLASQKDTLHVNELVQAISSVIEAFSYQQHGNNIADVRPELLLVGTAIYHGLTTWRSRQTLGEEFCDLIALHGNGTRPTINRFRMLTVMLAIVPYLYTRMIDTPGGWRSLWVYLGSGNTSRRLGMTPTGNSNRTYHVLTWVLSWTARAQIITVLLSRLHLGLFYFRGTYLDPIRRLLQIKYAMPRDVSPRPSYAVLGVFILVQMTLQMASNVYEMIEVRQREGNEGGKRDGVMLVPSMTVNSNAGTMSSFGNCGICLSPATYPSCPPCGHVFCYECVLESLMVKAECPLCRQEAMPQSVQCMYG